MIRISDVKKIKLPKFSDNRGILSFLEYPKILPFPINRVFFMYDIPCNINRGEHAHKECHQFLLAISGSFSVKVEDDQTQKHYNLVNSDYGLYIPPGIWAEEYNFSKGAICLVVASHNYDEDDYIRSYNEFKDGFK